MPTASVGSSIITAIVFDVPRARCPSFRQPLRSTLIVFTTSIINATTIVDFKRTAAIIIAHLPFRGESLRQAEAAEEVFVTELPLMITLACCSYLRMAPE